MEFYNVEGAEEGKPVVITLGVALGSVAFVPEVFETTLNLPTSRDPFYHVWTISDMPGAAYHTTTFNFIDQKALGNDVELVYRLNPANVYLGEGLAYTFVSHKVTTRAFEGYKDDPFTAYAGVVKAEDLNDGVFRTDVRLAAPETYTAGNSRIAAMQVYQGTESVVSDYIAMKSTVLTARLVDKDGRSLYDRTLSLAKEETDAFVKSFVPFTAAANFQMYYQEPTLKLGELVKLVNKVDLTKTIESYGFEDRVSYKFEMPAAYDAADSEADHTVQQNYIQLSEDGVVTLGEYAISSIGKKPIVRCDAYVDNQLVASAYIKIEITDRPATPVVPTPADPKTIQLNKYGQNYAYSTLLATDLEIADLNWQRASKEIYDAVNLKADAFWNYYGGANNEFKYEVTAIDAATNVEVKWNGTGLVNQLITTNLPAGLKIRVNETSADATENSSAEVFITNDIKTNHTYVGGKYTIKITVEEDAAVNVRGDIVFTHEFTVTEDCKPYELNELYAVGGNTVIVKGRDLSGWNMSSIITEHFKKIDSDNDGTTENILSYYNVVAKNVVDLDFAWKQGTTGVKDLDNPLTTTSVVELDGAMTVQKLETVMEYTVTLVNGETHTFNYNIHFINPFVGTSANLTIVDGVGAKTGNAMPLVRVNDTEGDVIYSWNTSALVLSTKATGTYKLTTTNVTFVEGDEFDELRSQLNQDANIALDTATGVVTWNNGGTKLQKDKTLTVVAKVEFPGLSVVECPITVTLKANN